MVLIIGAVIAAISISGVAYDRVQRRRAARLPAAGGRTPGHLGQGADPSAVPSGIGGTVSTIRGSAGPF